MQELDEILTALVVAPSNIELGNVVTTTRHMLPDRCEMQHRTLQGNVPEVHIDPGADRIFEQPRHGRATERGLESEVAVLGARSLQQSLAFVPGGAVDLRGRRPRVGGGDLSRGFIGVEVIGASRSDHRAADALFPPPFVPAST